MSERFWKIRCKANGLHHTSNFTGLKKGGKCYSTIGSARNAWNAMKKWIHIQVNQEYELVEFEMKEVKVEDLK